MRIFSTQAYTHNNSGITQEDAQMQSAKAAERDLNTDSIDEILGGISQKASAVGKNKEMTDEERGQYFVEEMYKLLSIESAVQRLQPSRMNNIRKNRFYSLRNETFFASDNQFRTNAAEHVELMYKRAMIIAEIRGEAGKVSARNKYEVVASLYREIIDTCKKDIDLLESMKLKMRPERMMLLHRYEVMGRYLFFFAHVEENEKNYFSLLEQALSYTKKSVTLVEKNFKSTRSAADIANYLKIARGFENTILQQIASTKSTAPKKSKVLEKEIRESKLADTHLLEAAKEDDQAKIKELLKGKKDQSVLTSAAIIAAQNDRDANIDALMTSLDKGYVLVELEKTPSEEVDKINAIKKIILHFELQKAFPDVAKRSPVVELLLSLCPEFQKDKIIFKSTADDRVLTVPISKLRKNVAVWLAKEAEISEPTLWELLTRVSVEQEKHVEEEKQVAAKKEKQEQFFADVAKLKARLNIKSENGKYPLDEKIEGIEAACDNVAATLKTVVALEKKIDTIKHTHILFSKKKGEKRRAFFDKQQAALQDITRQLAVARAKLQALPRQNDLLNKLDGISRKANMIALGELLQQEKACTAVCVEVEQALQSLNRQLADIHEILKSLHKLSEQQPKVTSRASMSVMSDELVSTVSTNKLEEKESASVESELPQRKETTDPAPQVLPEITAEERATVAGIVAGLKSLRVKASFTQPSITREPVWLKELDVSGDYQELEQAITQELSHVSDAVESPSSMTLLQPGLRFFPAGITKLHPEKDRKYDDAQTTNAERKKGEFSKSPGFRARFFNLDPLRLVVDDQPLQAVASSRVKDSPTHR